MTEEKMNEFISFYYNDGRAWCHSFSDFMIHLRSKGMYHYLPGIFLSMAYTELVTDRTYSILKQEVDELFLLENSYGE